MVTAIVGAGPMAVEHYKALAELGESVRVHGRSATSADAFSEKTGYLPMTGALDAQLVEAGVPDRAIVAVSVAELGTVTRTLLDAGCGRILVEKPGGLDPKEVADLAGHPAAERVHIAYNRRFLASTQRARQLVEEDGGVTSLRFEFTELAERIAASHHPAEVKANWFFANSTHVVDLAFFLAGVGGAPQGLTLDAAVVSGHLPWHPAGACFAGVGRIGEDVPFSYSADWSSAGRWGVEVNTPRRRIILQPLEKLAYQMKNSFEVVSEELPPETCKPGLSGMLRAFLDDEPSGDLLSLRDQAARLGFFARMLRPTTA